MTTATQQMTPAGFLKIDPHNHPDFVACIDPRCKDANKGGRDGTLLMPNLVELIRRIGGPDEIPDERAEDFEPIYGPDDPQFAVEWAECRFHRYQATLKDLGSRRPYLTLYRRDEALWVTDWHPREDALQLLFDIPTDWSAAPWGLPYTAIHDTMTASYDLDRLAAETLDYWIGAIQKATETYVHIRRDRFVF